METPRKVIIGLAGGIGSGKSTVASILRELGAAVIDSDRLGHEELNSPAVLEQIRGWWGPKVIGADGLADRQAIRRIVSQDAEQLRRLEQLLHPRIGQRSRELIARYESDPRVRAIVWDAPLLFEVGLDRDCDEVIFVEADRRLRAERVARTRGWTPEDLERWEKTQKPLEFKRARARYHVENNADPQALRREVEAVFSRILATS